MEFYFKIDLQKKNEKARTAAKAARLSQVKGTRKPRFSVHFHRPKTLSKPRDPKYPRKSAPSL